VSRVVERSAILDSQEYLLLRRARQRRFVVRLKNRLHGYLLVGAEAVHRFGLRSIARGLGHVGCRPCEEIARDRAEAPLEPPVRQGSASELELRPVSLRLQALDRLVTELLLRFGLKGADEDLLRSLLAAMFSVLSPSARRHADGDPARGTIRRAAETRAVHERLDEKRPVAPTIFPVFRQARQRQKKDVGGEPRDSRQDEKAAVGDNALEIARTRRFAPPDPAVAGSQTPRARREGESAEQSPRAANEVA
jgi:hypothetical protein